MTPKPKPSRKPAETRRASPEAVQKRRAARLFNKAILGEGRAGAADGRTERRRRRLLEELAAGSARGGKRELKPIDVLSRVQDIYFITANSKAGETFNLKFVKM